MTHERKTEYECAPHEHHDQLCDAEAPEIDELPGEELRHRDARGEDAVECAALHFVEQRATRSGCREKQKHHADTGAVEGDDRIVLRADDIRDVELYEITLLLLLSGQILQIGGLLLKILALLWRERATEFFERVHAAGDHHVGHSDEQRFLQHAADDLRRDHVGRIAQHAK